MLEEEEMAETLGMHIMCMSYKGERGLVSYGRVADLKFTFNAIQLCATWT